MIGRNEGPVRWAESQVIKQFGPKRCYGQKPFSGTIFVLLQPGLWFLLQPGAAAARLMCTKILSLFTRYIYRRYKEQVTDRGSNIFFVLKFEHTLWKTTKKKKIFWPMKGKCDVFLIMIHGWNGQRHFTHVTSMYRFPLKWRLVASLVCSTLQKGTWTKQPVVMWQRRLSGKTQPARSHFISTVPAGGSAQTKHHCFTRKPWLSWFVWGCKQRANHVK